MARSTTHWVTADAVVIRDTDIGYEVLLVKRRAGSAAYPNHWALPGGHVNPNEEVSAACLRELKEETGLSAELVGLIGQYSKPGRDPRGPYVTLAFLCWIAPGGDMTPKAADDAQDAQWWPIDKLPLPLAFDHEEVIKDGVEYFHSHYLETFW